MIVKDESRVIRRCIESVLPFIHAWSIVDTGSTDGTQKIIREALSHLPGELYERPWRDFGSNRTEAIELAKGKADYLLFMDADEVFEAPAGFQWQTLEADAYLLMLGEGPNRYWRELLVRADLLWRYEGVIHEYLRCGESYHCEKIEGPIVVGHFDGGRSQGLDVSAKYARDAKVLEEALKKEPENTRYTFFLAQSYRQSHKLEAALETYKKRAQMGGWDEEVWYSMLQLAVLGEQLNHPPAAVMYRYLSAHQFRPIRAEPLAYLATYCRVRREHALAYLYAKAAAQIPVPDDLLFLDQACYDWRAQQEYAGACYNTRRFAEACQAYEDLLKRPNLPDGGIEQVSRNLRLASDALQGKSL